MIIVSGVRMFIRCKPKGKHEQKTPKK